jgi:hypothetical protein
MDTRVVTVRLIQPLVLTEETKERQATFPVAVIREGHAEKEKRQKSRVTFRETVVFLQNMTARMGFYRKAVKVGFGLGITPIN